MTKSIDPGAARGVIRTVLRLEGLAALALATAAYFGLGGNPWLFALAFFAPDVSFLSFAAGPHRGSIGYNAAHSYLLPATIGAAGWLLGLPLLWQLALIIAAHIGFDRAMGYGLKYGSGFGDTYLGRVGRRA